MIKGISVKKMVAFLLLGVMLGMTTAAFAVGIATSGWGYYGPFSGYNYRNRAEINVVYEAANSTVYCEKNPLGGTVPNGYMGVQAYLYKDDVLVKNSIMQYNNTPTDHMSINTYVSLPSAGAYHAEGKTAAYNGNGNNYFYTFKSPSQNP